jgi:hypothetical protein
MNWSDLPVTSKSDQLRALSEEIDEIGSSVGDPPPVVATTTD